MRTELLTLHPGDDLLHAVDRLLRANISGAPVLDDDGNYLGVLSEKGALAALTSLIQLAGVFGLHEIHVDEFMTRQLACVRPEDDVFEAIEVLLSRQISGAPVVDVAGRYVGVFSEKTAMRALIGALYEWLPGASVAQYVNADPKRIIARQDRLIDVAHRFQTSSYRRLPIIEAGRIVGQVSRRDVLRAEQRLAVEVIAKQSDGRGGDRLDAAIDRMTVGQWMDADAATATPDTDLLSIANRFLQTPYRRMPVVRQHPDGKRQALLGQVSRRDLLAKASEILRPERERYHSETLYLSARGEEAVRPT
ncbi:MAG: CBS domain-containing protein [Planctomycetota bacterium]